MLVKEVSVEFCYAGVSCEAGEVLVYHSSDRVCKLITTLHNCVGGIPKVYINLFCIQLEVAKG